MDKSSIGSLALNQTAVDDQGANSFKRHLNVVNGKVHVVEVATLKELELFAKLPYEIYTDYLAWPGQNDEELMSFFDPNVSPYASYINLRPFIAYKDGQVVGRICAITNNHYNAYWGVNVGFFGFFESIDDQNVANALFGTAETVMKNSGHEKIIGPVSPTYFEEIGLLLDSYDIIPVKGQGYNPPYYVNLIEQYGFEKEKDLLHPSTDTNTLLAAMERRMPKIQPFLDDQNIYARYFDWDNFERDAEIIRELFSMTFQSHWGYYPADPEEWQKILQSCRPYIHEELFLILEDSGDPIAFTLCFQDTNIEKHAERHDIPSKCIRKKWDLVGIKPDYHRAGLGTFIVYNLIHGLVAYGTEEFRGSWVLEDNHNSLGLCRSVGLSFNTTYRVYAKSL